MAGKKREAKEIQSAVGTGGVVNSLPPVVVVEMAEGLQAE